MAEFLSMDDVKFDNKVVLVRADFNSPLDPETKKIIDDTRIRLHATTTIKELIQKNAKVVILAHQGRPNSVDFTTLEQHARILSKVLNRPVDYVDDLFGEKALQAIQNLRRGSVLVLKNTRSYSEEQKSKTPEEHAKSDFIKRLSSVCDIFVNDAFSSAHRAHASIVGFTATLPSVAGRIMERELNALGKILEGPDKPCVFLLGGAKADDALMISRYVLQMNIADYILAAGVTGQLFLFAEGYELGEVNKKFIEKEIRNGMIPEMQELLASYRDKIKTPSDVAIEVNSRRREISIETLPTSFPILDVGTKTISDYNQIISNAQCVVVSGPVGVYEKDEFAKGTELIFRKLAKSSCFSLVGGGHTISAIRKFGLEKDVSYMSTAGGALIEFLMGNKLPGVSSLEESARKHTIK